jgi:uncharacterized protein YlxW (UPF0749 family)
MDKRNNTIQQLLSLVPSKGEIESYKVIVAKKFEMFEKRINILENERETEFEEKQQLANKVEQLTNKVNDYETKIQQYKQTKKGS